MCTASLGEPREATLENTTHKPQDHNDGHLYECDKGIKGRIWCAREGMSSMEGEGGMVS